MKNIPHNAHFVAFLLLPLLLSAGSIASQPVTIHGQLKVVGSQLQNKNSKQVILRGQGYAWHNWWPQYWNADVVKWLALDWKCQILRAAMGVEPEGAYLSDSVKAINLVRTVVNAAIAEGRYIIIDWHAHEIHQNEAMAFFSRMAQEYGDKPNVIYEIFNEPDAAPSWDQVKTYSRAVINAIRQHDPDNIIIVGCPHWDQDINTVADSPLTGFTNIIYSVHFYAATHDKWLRDRCDYARGKNIPIIVSECSGTDASGSGQIDYQEWKAWTDYMDNNMISWLNYSVSDKAGEACSVLKPGASSTGGWTASELTETGIYMRNLLRSYPDVAVTTPAPESTRRLVTAGIHNGTIQVQFKLSDPQQVTCSLFDMKGSLVWSMHLGIKGAGSHRESIFTKNLAHGRYMVNVSIGGVSYTDQIVVIR
ncbi:MAG: cellulase family glycosylhydrolase [Chitinispirillaceae bacterium]|nr:cellulase family glycosylhydrolase [Chitinispirillaceae bacterium]